jgi:hypothetical protein
VILLVAQWLSHLAVLVCMQSVSHNGAVDAALRVQYRRSITRAGDRFLHELLRPYCPRATDFAMKVSGLPGPFASGSAPMMT